MLKRFVFLPIILIAIYAFAGASVYGESREEGIKLYDEGQALYKKGRSKEDLGRAVEKCEQALKIFEMVKFDKGVGEAANILAAIYAGWGQYIKAKEYFERSLEIAGKIEDPESESRALNNLGLIYSDLGRYSEAVRCYNKSLQIKTRLGDLRGEQATLNNLGNVYSIWGQQAEALGYYEKSLNIARKLGDMKAEAGALISIGLVHKDRGQYREAATYYEESLVIARRMGELGSEARCLNNLGNVHALWGKPSKAVEFYRKHLEISRKLGDLGGEGIALNNLGLVYTDWGLYSEAMQSYEESLAIKRKLGDVRGEAQVLNNLGLLRSNSGQYSKGVEYYENALQVFRQLGDLRGEMDTVGNLGNIYYVWGQYAKAINYYDKCLETALKIEDLASQGNAVNNLGLVYAAWGEYTKAAQYYEKFLTIARRLGDVRGEGIALMNLGNVHVHRGEYERALANFRIGLNKFEEVGAPGGWPKKLIGDLYLDLGDAAKAEPLLKEAGHNSSLARLCLFKSDYRGAKEYYERLRQSADKNRDVEDLFTAYTGLGTSYEGLGEDNRAEGYFLKAIDLIEDLRSSLSTDQRETFFDVRTNGFFRTAPYDGLARVRIRLNRFSEAFKDSEYTKSRMFAEVMSKSLQSTGFDISADVVNKDKDLNDQLAAIEKKLQEAYRKENQEVVSAIEPQVKGKERELEGHIKMLRERFPLFAATKYPKPMGLDETALKPDERVLVYHVTDPGVIIYLTKGKEIVRALFKPIARDELDSLVLNFRKPLEILPGRHDINEKLQSFDFAAGKRLSDLLLSDVLESLPTRVPVRIVPDDSLGTLPFEMLVLNDNGKIETNKDVPYVSGAEFFGDRNLVSYCQSVTALALARIHAKSKQTDGSLLAIADPVFQETDDRASSMPQEEAPTGVSASMYKNLNLMAGEEAGLMGGLKFTRLSLTGELARALAQMQKNGSDVFTGLDASKSNFLGAICPSLSHYDKVVFATHGYFGKDLPGIMEPVLVLTLVPPGTDGYLRMSEVMSLKMNADIVALTACQTGLGKRISGEGAMGMGRAFQYAGARSVLMSLWSVSEAASVDLVKSFFRNMKNGKTKSEALALAKAELRKSGFDHPFFWAGFILVGEEN